MHKYEIGQRVAARCKCGCIDVPDTAILEYAEHPLRLQLLALLAGVNIDDYPLYVVEDVGTQGGELLVPEQFLTPLGDDFDSLIEGLKVAKPTTLTKPAPETEAA